MKMPCLRWTLGFVLLGGLPFGSVAASPVPADTGEVEATLNRFHGAASRADGAAYFALLAPECVFLGTDAKERWTVDEFKAYAMPYFSKGQGWTYVPRVRHVQLSPQGDVAWFDEILDNKAYGVCRGSGVLRKAGGMWLICQYHLTVPIPNELAESIVGMIREANAPGMLVIGIDGAGAISVDGGGVPDGQLEPVLAQRRDAHPDIPVVIRVEEKTPADRIALAMDSCRRAGLGKFNLQAR